jgi:hypothetical protein
MNTLRLIALWLMRIGVALYAVTRNYKTILAFNTESVLYWVTLSYSLFAALMLVGGLIGKSWLTISSALFLIFITGYFAVVNVKEIFDHNFAAYVLIGGVAVYFAVNGNDSK